MDMLADLGTCVTSLCAAGDRILCLAGRSLYWLDRESGRVLREKQVFLKDGLSRYAAFTENAVYAADFCTLRAFTPEFEETDCLVTGADATSDVCGMAAVADTAYVSVRNGRLLRLRDGEVREYAVSDSSAWTILPTEKCVLLGTVSGHILALDRESMRPVRDIQAGKGNVRCLFADGRYLYAACQDMRLLRLDADTLKILSERRRAHGRMFDVAGVWRGRVVTVSHPEGAAALWDADTLTPRGRISLPLKLSGRAWVENDDLRLTSRSLPGIATVPLSSIEQDM